MIEPQVYQPVWVRDDPNTDKMCCFHSIVAMPLYASKSPEELRFEYYTHSRHNPFKSAELPIGEPKTINPQLLHKRPMAGISAFCVPPKLDKNSNINGWANAGVSLGSWFSESTPTNPFVLSTTLPNMNFEGSDMNTSNSPFSSITTHKAAHNPFLA